MTNFYESSARQALAELGYNRTIDEYIALVWAQRYPSPSPPSSAGWPFKPKDRENPKAPFKLRTVK